MSELPFLVVHGGLVAKTLVVAIPLLALGTIQLVRRRRDLRRARAEVRHRGLSLDAPRPGPIAIRGTFREAEGARWLDCAGERVALDGAVEIVRGTQARWRRRATRPEAGLRDGDDVIAHGLMTSQAESTVDASYRQPAGGWALARSVDRTGIELCATSPVPCPRPLAVLWLVAIVASFGAAGWFSLQQAGKWALRNAGTPRREPGNAYRRRELRSIPIAVAMPGTREDALLRTAFAITDLAYTAENDAMRLEFAERFGGCAAKVSELLAQNQFERAVSAAAACQLRPPLGALLALGRYDEAATRYRDVVDGHDAGVAMIGAGRWHDAIAMAEARIAHDRGQPDGREDARRCVKYHLQVRAGVPGADAHLRSAAGGSATCAAIEALTFPIPDPTSGLSDLVQQYPDNILVEAALMTGAWVPFQRLFVLASGIEPWIAPFIADSSTAPVGLVMARYLVERGDTRGAQAKLRGLDSIWRAQVPDEVEAIAFSVQLRGGEPRPDMPPGNPGRDRLASFRMGTATDEAYEALSYWGNGEVCDGLMRTAVASAVAGDGARLAAVVEQCFVHEDDLLAVAPRVVRARDLLASALRRRRFASRSFPFGFLRDAAVRRDLARLVGDDNDAARWQSMVEQHLKVLGDRDRFISLLIWSRA